MTDHEKEREEAYAVEAAAIQAIIRTQGFKFLVAGIDQRLKSAMAYQVGIVDPNYGIQCAYRDGQIAAYKTILNSLERAIAHRVDPPPAEAQ